MVFVKYLFLLTPQKNLTFIPFFDFLRVLVPKKSPFGYNTRKKGEVYP